jgi:integrase/recombinase XerC
MDDSTASFTMAQARDDYVRWLRECRDLSGHTIRAYCADVTALVVARRECRTVGDLRPATIRLFFDQQRSSGLRSATLRRRAASIRGFCRFLDSRHLASANPWPPEGLAFQRGRHLPRALPADDLARLLGYLMGQAAVGEHVAADQPLARPVPATTLLGAALMLATGLRVGELVSFRASDINLSNRSIQVLARASVSELSISLTTGSPA